MSVNEFLYQLSLRGYNVLSSHGNPDEYPKLLHGVSCKLVSPRKAVVSIEANTYEAVLQELPT